MSSGDSFTLKVERVFMCMCMYTLSILKTTRMYVHYIEHLLPVIVCGLFNISVGERHLPSDANIMHHLPEDTLHTCSHSCKQEDQYSINTYMYIHVYTCMYTVR